MKKGWEIKKLGEVCEVIAGQSPEGKYYNDNENGLPFYQGKKEFTEKYIGKPTTWTTKITKEAIKDDILMSVRAPVGPINFSTQKICIGRGLTAIRASKLIHKEYLFNFLIKHENEIIGNAGAVFNSINKNQIENIQIPLPSFSEQQHIVSKLHEAFAAISKVKENAEKNVINARELFESYLQSVFANKGVGWEENNLGEICDLMTGGTPSTSKPEYFDKGDIRWLVSGDVNIGEICECEGRITELGMKNSNAKFLPINSVIIALNGQGKTRGTVAMLRTKATCNQSIVSLFPKDSQIIVPEYIFYNLKSRYQEIRKITGDTGNDRRGLNMLLIRNIKITYPKSINEQQNLINKFILLLKETKKLEEIYQKKKDNLEELKKSILERAFAGEL